MKASLLAIFAAPAFAFSADPDSFDQLFSEIAPPAGEVWRSIPWETSLLEAQAMAAEAQKPLFIWAMDGHPLGCT